jgi:rfaE bifunctional protein nucleotidyltransferase chain/domain
VVEASAFVACGAAGAHAAGSGPFGGRPDTRAGGANRGVLVATGGCFDILHAGHVAMLRAARALGDRLLVCLNSDASVRRLKGPGRPIVDEDGRAAVLRALAYVDDVVVFDEDTPEAVLRRIRPSVWVKGGDYAGGDLPESRVLAEWGGRAVIVPYLAQRSTTGILEEVVRRAVD